MQWKGSGRFTILIIIVDFRKMLLKYMKKTSRSNRFYLYSIETHLRWTRVQSEKSPRMMDLHCNFTPKNINGKNFKKKNDKTFWKTKQISYPSNRGGKQVLQRYFNDNKWNVYFVVCIGFSCALGPNIYLKNKSPTQLFYLVEAQEKIVTWYKWQN